MDQPPPTAKDRNAAMDAARGLAVLGMIFIHLIPTEGAVTPAGQLVTGLARQLSGKPAALFFVLAGMAWALQQQRAGWTQQYLLYVLKRSLVLVAIGHLLHLLIWPTEVLTSLGFAFPIAAYIFSRGRRAIWVCLALILVAVPLSSHVLHGWALNDWGDAGEPKLTFASSGKLLLLDGDYPLMPWLAFVLIGMLAVQIKAKFAVWALGSLATSLTTLLLVNLVRAEPGSILSIDWTPTTLPFLVTCGGFAMATIFGLSGLMLAQYRSHHGIPPLANIKDSVTVSEAYEGGHANIPIRLAGALQREPSPALRGGRQGGGEPNLQKSTSGAFRRCKPLRSIGAMSLTHYVGHIALVILPLRHFFPEEEWPTRIGFACLALYVLTASVFSTLWLCRYRRGPLESVLAWITGSPRSTSLA